MKLTYCIDPAGLSSWLSLAPTRELVQQTGINVSVVPMTRSLGNVATDSQQKDDPLAEYKARRARARNKFADEELRRDCERLGISLAAGSRKIDGTAGALAMMKLQDQGLARIEFAEQWFSRVIAHAESPEAVAQVSAEDPQALQAFTALMDHLLEQGLFSAPSYLLELPGEEPERFHGRQHLPLLRWLIDGRIGRPPV